MKTLTLKTLILAISLIIFASLCAVVPIYSEMGDKNDKISQDQSQVFSPGYINAAKQKTEAIINQSEAKTSLWDRILGRANDKVSDKVAEDSRKEVTPELKVKKTGGADSTKTTSVAVAGAPAAVFPTAEAADKALAVAREKGVSTTALSNGNKLNIWIEGDKSYFSVTNSKGDALLGKSQFSSPDNLQKNYISSINDMGSGSFTVIVTSYGNTTDGDWQKFDIVQTFRMYNNKGVATGETNFRSHDYINIITGAHDSHFITPNDIASGDPTNDKLINYRDLAIFGGLYNKKLSQMNTQADIDKFMSLDFNKDGVIDNEDQSFLTNVAYNKTTDQVAQYTTNFKMSTYTPGNVVISQPESSPKADPYQDASNITGADMELYKANPFDEKYGSKTLDANIAENKLSGNPAADKLDMARKGDDVMSVLLKMVPDRDVMAIPLANANQGGENIDFRSILSSIFKNPTEDQKMMLDSVQALLQEVNKIEQESASPEAIKKASDDLLQMVAAALVAQAIPDLLKEGDVSNIKNVFSELNNSKSKIILDYQGSTKPYYDEVIKELAKNIAALQLNNIISSSLTREDIEKLPRDEIDKIIDKIRKMDKKSFAEEYILQQEKKYRERYIAPNNKIMEERMKAMMKDFTKELSRILEGSGVVKK